MTSAQQKMSYLLSSYSGSDLEQQIENNFDADELYELVGMDLSSFDGTFKDQRNAGRTLDLTLVGGASDDTLYINPDLRIIETENGHPVSGKGIGGFTIAVTTSPGTPKALYRWLHETPNNCMGIRVTCSDPVQLTNNFTITEFKDGPMNDGISETVNTSTFTNERDFKDNMISVTRPMFFDLNTRIAYQVNAGKTVKLTLMFGARQDLIQNAQASVRRALDKKTRAAQNMPLPRNQRPAVITTAQVQALLKHRQLNAPRK